MTDSKGEDKKSVEVDGEWKDKIGSKRKDFLLAIYADDNKKVWEHLNLQFQKDKPSSGFFSDSSNGSEIKDICKKAYAVVDAQDSSGTDVTQPKADELYKWCSLKGAETTVS